MAKIKVYNHSTGSRLTSKEIAKLSEDLTSAQFKEACRGDHVNYGFFTKKEGKGTKVGAIGVGKGASRVYYQRDELTDSELNEIKDLNFKRVMGMRMTKTVKDFKGLINAANDSIHNWTEEEAGKIMATLQAQVVILENKLFNVKEAKKSKDYVYEV